MVLAYDYPFLDIMGTMLVFFAWVIWFWLLITVFADIFRRHDIGGGGKVLWMIFVIILPFLGVFIYLIAESKGMAERNVARAEAEKAQFDAYVQNVAASSGGGAAAEIEKAKGLLDSGAITQAEYDALKRRRSPASLRAGSSSDASPGAGRKGPGAFSGLVRGEQLAHDVLGVLVDAQGHAALEAVRELGVAGQAAGGDLHAARLAEREAVDHRASSRAITCCDSRGGRKFWPPPFATSS